MPGEAKAVAPALSHPPAGVKGLTSEEAARRLATDGPNRVISESRSHRLRRLAGPLADPMVALLWSEPFKRGRAAEPAKER